MSTISKSDAVVLKSLKYRESSKIVAFYTRGFGKLTGIVKGALRPRSRYGSSLEPMSYVNLVFYRKEGRDIQTISECDTIKSFRRLSEDLDLMAAGMTIIELVDLVAYGEVENIPVFNLLVDSLESLNTIPGSPSGILYHFELHLARALGFGPSFGDCVSCGSDRTVCFHISMGGLLCAKCASLPGQTVKMSGGTVDLLRRLAGSRGSDKLPQSEITPREAEETDKFLWTYLRFHVSGIRNLKSSGVFSKIRAPA